MEISFDTDEFSCSSGTNFCGFAAANSELDGRKVKVLAGDASQYLNTIAKSQTRITTKMSRPDNATVDVSGGINESQGAYVEGRLSISWGDSKDSKSSEKDKPND